MYGSRCLSLLSRRTFSLYPLEPSRQRRAARVAPFAVAVPAGSGSGLEAQTLDGTIRECSLAQRACEADYATPLLAPIRLPWAFTALYAMVQERATRQNACL